MYNKYKISLHRRNGASVTPATDTGAKTGGSSGEPTARQRGTYEQQGPSRTDRPRTAASDRPTNRRTAVICSTSREIPAQQRTVQRRPGPARPAASKRRSIAGRLAGVLSSRSWSGDDVDSAPLPLLGVRNHRLSLGRRHWRIQMQAGRPTPIHKPVAQK